MSSATQPSVWKSLEYTKSLQQWHDRHASATFDTKLYAMCSTTRRMPLITLQWWWPLTRDRLAWNSYMDYLYHYTHIIIIKSIVPLGT